MASIDLAQLYKDKKFQVIVDLYEKYKHTDSFNQKNALYIISKSLVELNYTTEHIRFCWNVFNAGKLPITESLPSLMLALAKVGQSQEALDLGMLHINNPDCISLDKFHFALGLAFQTNRQLVEAKECYLTAIALNKSFLPAKMNLAVVEVDLGNTSEGLKLLELLLDENFTGLPVPESIMLTMLYDANLTSEKVNRIRKKIVQLSKQPRHLRLKRQKLEFNKEIRLGFVSGNFYRHSVMYFLLPILNEITGGRFKTFGYYTRSHKDEITEQLEVCFNGFRWVENKRAHEIYDIIGADNIDVLFDLDGHTQGSRIDVFNLRPAPVQISWIGFPERVASTSIDYWLVDQYTNPELNVFDECTGSSLLKMPSTFLLYDGDKSLNIKNSVEKKFTFGSYNNFAKITPVVLDVWAEILKSNSNFTMIIKNKQLASKISQSFILDRLVRAGVNPDQITLLSQHNSYIEHMESYNDIHLALDTFPYNGTTTTFEAIWMGVPTLVLEGDLHVSRVGVSILKNLNMENLIATSLDMYIRLAIDIGNEYLSCSRGTDLRRLFLQSPLGRKREFVRDFERLICDIGLEGKLPD